MCGCTNNTNGSNQCTILLIIIIFALQGLLNGSPQSKTALVLLFLYWLCGNRGCGSMGCGNMGCGNNACNQVNTCAMPVYSMPESCCCKSKKRRHRDECTCKCERVKVCMNSGKCCC